MYKRQVPILPEQPVVQLIAGTVAQLPGNGIGYLISVSRVDDPFHIAAGAVEKFLVAVAQPGQDGIVGHIERETVLQVDTDDAAGHELAEQTDDILLGGSFQ